MGFGTSVAGTLVIVTFLIIGVNFFVVLTDITETSSSLLNQEREDASIELSSKSSQTNNQTNITTLSVTAENRGEINLDPEKVDLYKDGLRQNRSSLNTEIVNEVDNPGLWSPGELLNVSVEEDRNNLDDFTRITITNNKGQQISTVIEVK